MITSISSSVTSPSKVDLPLNISDTAAIISVLKKVTTEVTFTNIFIGSKGASDSYMRANGGKFNASVSPRTVAVLPKVSAGTWFPA